MLLKTACSARGGVLYTQLAKFAALAVQAGVRPQTENCERRTAKTLITGRYRSGQTGQTVNLLAHAFAGSNPALPILRHLASSAASDFALLNTKSTLPPLWLRRTSRMASPTSPKQSTLLALTLAKYALVARLTERRRPTVTEQSERSAPPIVRTLRCSRGALPRSCIQEFSPTSDQIVLFVHETIPNSNMSHP
jgi:hypothetical protein